MAGTHYPSGTVASNSITCPDCGATPRHMGHEVVCPDCSAVVEESAFDHGPQFSGTPEEVEEHSRVGPASTLRRHDHGIGAEIGYTSGDTRQMGRMRVQNSRSKFTSKRERNQMYGLSETQRVAKALDAGDDTIDRACYLFRRAHDAGLAQGRDLDQLAASVCYIALRENSMPAFATEFGTVARCDASAVVAGAKEVQRELDGVGVPPLTPADHVPRLASDLGIDASETKSALDLAIDALNDGTASGKSPSAFAGACIYAVSAGHTQAEIADAANCGIPTLRKHWRTVRDV